MFFITFVLCYWICVLDNIHCIVTKRNLFCTTSQLNIYLANQTHDSFSYPSNPETVRAYQGCYIGFWQVLWKRRKHLLVFKLVKETTPPTEH